VMSLPDPLASKAETFAGAALVIAAPSLLIGCGVAWWCGRALWRQTVGPRITDKR